MYVARKVNWKRYAFPLAYKLSLLESNRHSILPISLPYFSFVISRSEDWVCDFKFYKCNITRKCWHKYAISEYQCKQVSHAKNHYLIYLSNTSLLGKWEGDIGRSRERMREKTCILESKYIISTNLAFSQVLFLCLIWIWSTISINVNYKRDLIFYKWYWNNKVSLENKNKFECFH